MVTIAINFLCGFVYYDEGAWTILKDQEENDQEEILIEREVECLEIDLTGHPDMQE